MGKQLCISVSGGGALGIGPLAFMKKLEADTGKKLADLAVGFSGTSTGAIIAALLEEGYTAADMFDLYRNNLSTIFHKYPWYKRILPKCPKYNNSNLKKMLQEKLVGKVSSWKKPFFIPATCMNGKSVEKVWDIGDTDTDKWLAVLTSTAAPTYFDCVYDGSDCYIDGGMWKNCPIDVLNAGMKYTKYNHNIKILSFNTTLDTPHTDKGNKTLIGWGEYILSEWVARSGKSGDFEVKADIGPDNVAIASPYNKHKISMDKIDDSTVNNVISIWESYYDTYKDYFIKFIEE